MTCVESSQSGLVENNFIEDQRITIKYLPILGDYLITNKYYNYINPYIILIRGLFKDKGIKPNNYPSAQHEQKNVQKTKSIPFYTQIVNLTLIYFPPYGM